MRPLALLSSAGVIAIVLWDAFETVVLPRTVSRRLRLARLYFRVTWITWCQSATMFRAERRRERFLAVYGPLSLLGLAVCGRSALIRRSPAALVHRINFRPVGRPTGRFLDDLYMSGTTFFTLGLGDSSRSDASPGFLTVAEAGTGFAFLAIVIAYFPVLYQSFSRREARLTLLDAWAGSPPAAAEVLRRLAARDEMAALQIVSEGLGVLVLGTAREPHLVSGRGVLPVAASAPVLGLGAGDDPGPVGARRGRHRRRAEMAGARHVRDRETRGRRSGASAARRARYRRRSLSDGELEELRRQLESAGLRPARSPEADSHLLELRRSYEPYISALARRLMMPAPPWSAPAGPERQLADEPERRCGSAFIVSARSRWTLAATILASRMTFHRVRKEVAGTGDLSLQGEMMAGVSSNPGRATSRNVSPSSNSETRYDMAPCVAIWCTARILGWFSDAAARASCPKRRKRSGSLRDSEDYSFRRAPRGRPTSPRRRSRR